MGVCLTLCWVRLGQDCRGRRPGILDAVHVLRPARSEVVVKLGARRAASLTQRATAWSMRDAVHYVRMRFMRVVIHEWCSPYVWADIMLG